MMNDIEKEKSINSPEKVEYQVYTEEDANVKHGAKHQKVSMFCSTRSYGRHQ